jgi:hypothetical protein
MSEEDFDEIKYIKLLEELDAIFPIGNLKRRL